MTTTPEEPDRELREEIEGVGGDVFAASQTARHQDMINSATDVLNAALREQGRESEVMTPREFAALGDAVLSDPEYVAELTEKFGEDVTQRLMDAGKRESLYEPEGGDE